MEQESILIEVLTPEGQALSVRTRAFTLNTALGRMGVMKGHAPLAALVEPGELVWQTAEGESRMELGRGLLELHWDKATILVEQAGRPAKKDKEDKARRGRYGK